MISKDNKVEQNKIEQKFTTLFDNQNVKLEMLLDKYGKPSGQLTPKVTPCGVYKLAYECVLERLEQTSRTLIRNGKHIQMLNEEGNRKVDVIKELKDENESQYNDTVLKEKEIDTQNDVIREFQSDYNKQCVEIEEMKDHINILENDTFYGLLQETEQKLTETKQQVSNMTGHLKSFQNEVKELKNHSNVLQNQIERSNIEYIKTSKELTLSKEQVSKMEKQLESFQQEIWKLKSPNSSKYDNVKPFNIKDFQQTYRFNYDCVRLHGFIFEDRTQIGITMKGTGFLSDLTYGIDNPEEFHRILGGMIGYLQSVKTDDLNEVDDSKSS